MIDTALTTNVPRVTAGLDCARLQGIHRDLPTLPSRGAGNLYRADAVQVRIAAGRPGERTELLLIAISIVIVALERG